MGSFCDFVEVAGCRADGEDGHPLTRFIRRAPAMTAERKSYGFTLRDPYGIVSTTSGYRRFIQELAAEFSCA